MAKILYSTIGFGVKELYCYHDQFTNALKKHGNEVLVMTSNKIIKNGWSSNDHFSYVDEKKLDEFIKSFNPDLVIASNNVLYNRVPKIIDCPIVIFAADKPIGYADNDKIKKNVDAFSDLLFFFLFFYMPLNVGFIYWISIEIIIKF